MRQIERPHAAIFNTGTGGKLLKKPPDSYGLFMINGGNPREKNDRGQPIPLFNGRFDEKTANL